MVGEIVYNRLGGLCMKIVLKSSPFHSINFYDEGLNGLRVTVTVGEREFLLTDKVKDSISPSVVKVKNDVFAHIAMGILVEETDFFHPVNSKSNEYYRVYLP